MNEMKVQQKPKVDSTWIKEDGEESSVVIDGNEKKDTQKKPFFL